MAGRHCLRNRGGPGLSARRTTRFSGPSAPSEPDSRTLRNPVMSEKKGILRMQSSGRWAVCRPGRAPVEIMSGELFRVEVDGELRLTRMEEVWGEGYYSVDLYPLCDGMRAAIRADK